MALATSADVRTVYAASAMETEIHRLSAELSSRWSLSTIDGDDLTQTSFRRHQRNITWPILVPPHSPVSPLDAELPGFPVLPERPRSPLRLTFGSARRSTRRSQTITPPPPEKDFNSYNYSSVQFPERIHTRITLSSSGTIISEKRASVQVHDRGSVQSSAPEVDSIEEQKSSCSKPLPITTVGQRYS
nr:hypothetical protein CFP56_16577 [Quercus suber]